MNLQPPWDDLQQPIPTPSDVGIGGLPELFLTLMICNFHVNFINRAYRMLFSWVPGLNVQLIHKLILPSRLLKGVGWMCTLVHYFSSASYCLFFFGCRRGWFGGKVPRRDYLLLKLIDWYSRVETHTTVPTTEQFSCALFY